MRVLHVMASGVRGGGAEHMAALLPELRRLGVECEAAVGSEGPLAERLATLGFRVHALELMASRTDPSAPLRVARLLRQVRPDVVHYHGTRAAFFGALARPLVWRPPRAVYTVHGLSYRKETRADRRAVFLASELLACRAAQRVISVSRADLEDLRRRRFVANGRGVHIPNPLDTERFAPGDREAARARLGLRLDEFVVGTVSRLVPAKAVGDLVEAIRFCPRGVLVVVGDGPQRVALEERARPLGERVRFLGSRDDVPEVLRAFDVFALASRWEGEPIALLEAMATGLPCVATATEGTREVLDGSGAGILVGIGAPAALAAALEQLAAAPFHRREMGRAGRAAAEGRSATETARAAAKVYR